MGEVIDELKPLFGKRRILFRPHTKQAAVPADGEIVFRVIQNLLANALKFTKADGQILVNVEPAGNMMRVSVQDDGPGIAPEYRQKVFEKFAQVQLPSGRQKSSTGLGLTFCKLAVKAHGGNIGVDSGKTQGSTFWFELPLSGTEK